MVGVCPCKLRGDGPKSRGYAVEHSGHLAQPCTLLCRARVWGKAKVPSSSQHPGFPTALGPRVALAYMCWSSDDPRASVLWGCRGHMQFWGCRRMDSQVGYRGLADCGVSCSDHSGVRMVSGRTLLGDRAEH